MAFRASKAAAYADARAEQGIETWTTNDPEMRDREMPPSKDRNRLHWRLKMASAVSNPPQV